MVNLSKFAENLSELMERHGLNAPMLAKILRTDRSNITRYLRGERLPQYGGFVAMIEYFNCSADVLLGRLDYAEEVVFLPVLPFGERLRTVMSETKTTQYRLEKDLKISGGSVYRWLFDQALPSVDSLEKLAEYMDVRIDYLLGRIQ